MTDLEKFLLAKKEADLLRFSTAGSVDDGKSTLIGRLLYEAKGIYEDQLDSITKRKGDSGGQEIDFALVTDGLKAEREQSITIDVAYRYFSTPKRHFIIADTPGHEQYTRNMVTGASTAHLAVILIDAQRGVSIQSKRHGFIASLMKIPRVVIAINKMDLVDYSQEVYEQIQDIYRDFAARLNVVDLTFIPVSALRGDNVVVRSDKMPWYTGQTLLQHLETVHVGSDINLVDFRFPVQYVLSDNGFRGYAGTMASGIIRLDEEVMVLPAGKTSRVKNIIFDRKEVDYAFSPQSVAIQLYDELDISRGDMLVRPNNLPEIRRELEAMVVWMSNQALKPEKTYLIKHTTRTVRGMINHLHYRVDPNQLHRENAESLVLNEIGRISITMLQPIIYDEYSRNRETGSFIMIDPLTHETAGVGMIIERTRSMTQRHLQSSLTHEPVSQNIVQQRGKVSSEDRQRLLGHKPFTIWMTGLSGSGKSTISFELEKHLFDAGYLGYVLDGDNIRAGLNRDLGFSSEDRKENIRRVAELARLLNETGLVVITAFISPIAEDRQMARDTIGSERFIEVFLDMPLHICEQRDPKGLYKKARKGQISEFTGITAPYEPPVNPDIWIQTDQCTPNQAVERIMDFLRSKNLYIDL